MITNYENKANPLDNPTTKEVTVTKRYIIKKPLRGFKAGQIIKLPAKVRVARQDVLEEKKDKNDKSRAKVIYSFWVALDKAGAFIKDESGNRVNALGFAVNNKGEILYKDENDNPKDEVEVGEPAELYWRRRYQDSHYDDCMRWMSLLSPPPEPKPEPEPPEILKENKKPKGNKGGNK